MRAILKETGGLTPKLWARTEQVFAAIEDARDVATIKRALSRAALRLEVFALNLRREHEWHVSLLPPAGGQETVQEVEDRALRQLWQQHRHLGTAVFCKQFCIGRPTLYRRLGVASKAHGGLSMARGPLMGYNLRQQTMEGSLLKPAAPGSKQRSFRPSVASERLSSPKVKAS
jgi:hypothetical protein